MSRQHQPLTFGFRYWIAELFRGINPQSHRLIDVTESGFLRVAMNPGSSGTSATKASPSLLQQRIVS